jgi:ParB family transcriptional regulator, chromosome partitioning protein
LAKESARSSIRLPSVDDLFKTDESRADDRREKVMEIPLSEISDFPNHPFHVKQDESMLEMADSVKQYGILVPALVRPKEGGGYEMVAGHRRKMASELAGQETIPCIVRELDDDESTIIMVDSNLQRENIVPSEKAFAYKMKLEALNRRAGRPSKENYCQVGNNYGGKTSNEIVAENSSDSSRQIARYIRLTELAPPLRDMVDEKQIALNPAVELSYLAEDEQQSLLDTIRSEECTPSLAQAQRMKKLSQEGRLSTDVIYSILTEEKPQQNNLTLKSDVLNKYFPKDFTPKQKEDVILKLLDKWYRSRQQEHER